MPMIPNGMNTATGGMQMPMMANGMNTATGGRQMPMTPNGMNTATGGMQSPIMLGPNTLSIQGANMQSAMMNGSTVIGGGMETPVHVVGRQNEVKVKKYDLKSIRTLGNVGNVNTAQNNAPDHGKHHDSPSAPIQTAGSMVRANQATDISLSEPEKVVEVRTKDGQKKYNLASMRTL